MLFRSYKITYLLKCDYGINISVGRVYRLMKQLQLPKMSTDKPRGSVHHSGNTECHNHLQQNFAQKAPNRVWVSGITCIRAGSKWHYLCIVMDLYFRKITSWHISANAGARLVITAFRKAYEKRNAPVSFSSRITTHSSVCARTRYSPSFPKLWNVFHSAPDSREIGRASCRERV